jgi:hypothetical protein
VEYDEATFDVREPTAARTTPVTWIQDLVDKVARSSLEADLTHLVSFPTRHSTSDHYADAAAWARSQLEAMNYETRSQSVTVNGGASTSVIADKPGGGDAPAGNSTFSAVYIYVGQFVDHDDITLEKSGQPGMAPPVDPDLKPLPLDDIREQTRKVRTGVLELDSVYNFPARRDPEPNGLKMKIGKVTDLGNRSIPFNNFNNLTLLQQWYLGSIALTKRKKHPHTQKHRTKKLNLGPGARRRRPHRERPQERRSWWWRRW